ncbi:5-oxoprolinase subunit C family protein [Cesiribacter andamanensis]|uniref:Allophanate hydrolase subunit 2 n=1 Tax=Cesiribacter andamanensis AMV16 TaxID=1279009 RepID=M7NSD6_9BACT|nr:biotin-dependent carboxyltransferase family protein [Cesiribacter andamanensis]EMR04605.1 Allophanate hydrolase subunit 2 [Cesiribacter andamanensis AMV16]
MALRVLQSGLQTTVQDCGRRGFQALGMVVSGAMDAVALRLGNLLVGNLPGAAALELTLTGPTLLLEKDQLMALTGAPLRASLGGTPLPLHQPFWAKEGSILRLGALSRGCRSYLSLAGGVSVPPLLGSASTYLRAGLGGFRGRALQADDLLQTGPAEAQTLRLMELLRAKAGPAPWAPAGWGISGWNRDLPLAPAMAEPLSLRCLPGPEWEVFTAESQQQFWQTPFVLSPQSDRMGCRLQGPALHLQKQAELLSSAVTFGTVQVPPGGQAIVLGADRQTTGGYPRIAQVISADLPILAQARPGTPLHFREVGMAEAQQALMQQEAQLQQLQRALDLKMNYPA